jgi:phospholipid/cholesterol/gamma-HCH transport system ATP-binding protein
MPNKITINNLYKSFGEKRVLNGISLEIAKSESLVIIGGSGTGKSVLIKIISGLMNADKGEIFIDNINFIKAKSQEKSLIIDKMGFLFQGGALFDSMSIWENIAFRLINHHKINAKKAKDIAVENLELVGLNAKVANLYPSELSGGMQKRASLARTIATKPEIIFFDEPTTGLDPIMSDVINELIITNSKKLGATTITITHDLQSAKKIADKVAMLYQGQIIWQDDVNKMFSSDNPFVNQFVSGSSTGPISF